MQTLGLSGYRHAAISQNLGSRDFRLSSRTPDNENPTSSGVSTSNTTSSAAPAPVQELSDAEKEQIRKLQARDQEVRTHEQAHIAAGGAHVSGGIQYHFQTGPDNKQYAVGGEVHIDPSPVPGDPQATIQKMQTLRQAALSPANPSPQDLRAAAQASRLLLQAQQELTESNQPGRQLDAYS